MTNVSNISNISNSIKTMPVITHNGVPVVTTETIASLYDTVVGNIKTNFSRNAKRFIEGKHYFKLTGSVLKDFKNKVTKSNLVACAKNAKHLTLWTERGAARHAKMLDTDNAWDVFEALEDFYFAKKEDAQQKINLRQSTAKELTPLRQTAERLIATGVGNIYPDIWKHVHKEFGVEHINELLPEQIPQAISFLDALEGEYLPKQAELPMVATSTLTDDELLNLCYVWNDSLEMIRLMLDVEPLLQVAEHKLAPRFYEKSRDAMRKTNLLRRTIEKATEHIQIKRNEFSEWRILHRIRIPDMPW
ncbi:ORF6N domain-containing protein [Providencia rettgeri]|uniref:ORF6N domain-containing protein n=1 Tax=Providencia rettgeri TaxID=587 RepID=UPI001B387803|nr:ORF6N domain-containing protein [Providencia rettgeri]MBQ0262589.1 ORF6N domain-containing protein [Providencia rettgeri]MCB4857637.1 ORF6N domain-containing protein [Providencia rettgeri]MCD6316942.1 ORF6N domain-containing protein [Providencia rettgeri]